MKSLGWFMPIAGLLAIGLGIAALFRPLTSLATIAIFFGISILSSGISEIVSFYSARKGYRSGWMLTTGIMSIVFGLWATIGVGTYAVARFIPFIFAGWVMALGIERIADAVARKYVENEDVSTTYMRSVNKLGLLLGVLTLLTSIILMFNPLMSARLVSIMLSILLVTYGVNTIELFFRIKQASRAVKKAEKKAAAAIIEAEEQGDIDNATPPVNENWFKRTLRTKGKKVLILFIVAHIVKFIIIAIGFILVAS